MVFYLIFKKILLFQWQIRRYNSKNAFLDTFYSSVFQLGEQKPDVQSDADRIPDYYWNVPEDNAVNQPDDTSQQHRRIKEKTYLTGAFKFIDTHDLRDEWKGRKKPGSKTQIFGRGQSATSLFMNRRHFYFNITRKTPAAATGKFEKVKGLHPAILGDTHLRIDIYQDVR